MAQKSKSAGKAPAGAKASALDRILNGIERVGNALPDPALLFVIALGLVWLASAAFGGWFGKPVSFEVPARDPITGDLVARVETIKNLLTGDSLVDFLARMVTIFTSFHPLGVVLVALLGVGVAEHSGFINAGLKSMLGVTPKALLTPMVILVAIVSHTAADAGYVLVIPLGAVIFYAAGRHPLAGIAAAFAGVSGGFSANFLISGIDPLLQGLTQVGAQVMDPQKTVNPLCNWWFTAASSVLVTLVGWFITDRVVEPRLKRIVVDGDPADMPKMERATPAERRGMWAGLATALAGVLVLVLICLPEDSPMRDKPGVPMAELTLKSGERLNAPRDAIALAGEKVLVPKGGGAVREIPATEVRHILSQRGAAWIPMNFVAVDPARDGARAKPGVTGLLAFEGTAAPTAPGAAKERSLTSFGAGLMKSIVPLIMILFLLPGIVHGYVSGTFKSHKDIIKGMAKSMSSMGYYLVMAFCASLFIDAFNTSGLGKWIAVSGADGLKQAALPLGVTVVGIIFLTAAVNLLIGSASAKWALLAPIFVPMLMQLGIAPEFTQAAYRVGDSTTNIVTPLMPYFPLVVAFSQRYVKNTGIGTLVSMMLPYTVSFLIAWTIFLLAFWGLGIPLGVGGAYSYSLGG